jgi:hypothetical protein
MQPPIAPCDGAGTEGDEFLLLGGMSSTFGETARLAEWGESAGGEEISFIECSSPTRTISSDSSSEDMLIAVVDLEIEEQYLDVEGLLKPENK